MKKISSNKTDKMLLLFIVKSLLCTIISIVVFSLISSKIILDLDIDVSNAKIFTIVITVLSSAITTFVSTKGFKNNGILLGIVSQIPLIIFCLVNAVFHNHNFLFLLVKIILIILTSSLIGNFNVKTSKKIKVN